MSDLKPCPCGKIPTDLVVEFLDDQDVVLFHGGCCAWAMIEPWGDSRTKSQVRDTIQAKWNAAKRKTIVDLIVDLANEERSFIDGGI